MKKLMIAAAIVCAAAMSQAASVTWNSGTIVLPSGEEAKEKGDATGYLFVMNSTQYGAMQAAIAAYSGDLTGAGAIASYVLATEFEKNEGASLFGATVYTSGTSLTTGQRNMTDKGDLYGTGTSGTKKIYTTGDTAYAAIIYTTEETGDMMYLGNYGQTTLASSSNATVNNMALYMEGNGTAKVATSWQSVPEPTSAMLLLLGVAGLALKRKRA